ncbi:carboxy-S-adenosyl-L-methionine synthase CmoA [Candidatus Methylospira mobilis]|uniref:Carboxy-S-adenosyl-L-methionine synthase n=1 Tax=Candidatus Methylospira mobilis TaxID=1808979 RepID=A0A5Q0BIZ4_9GAMM|nr:carboxy-S-adenosyl-L-methionine synthase CmoA [Candidatus Methylospira mobilis]QFY41796.1 carboxy-S-adenosyl-L-methionine synthase CmoA [Candidatus Methylospira mobilis]WNV06659.1 carboxy-S-adenosyl-L-methionine synthase CmoA [Candidatus Methylospira mobilis]
MPERNDDRLRHEQHERDSLFATPALGDFRFDVETARVFDDMINRSVPLYPEIQRMIGEIAADFAQPGTRLFDLGCATGATLTLLDQEIDNSVRFIGIDNSDDMLDKARRNFSALDSARTIEWINADLHQNVPIESASVVIMNLTLQFIRPLYRQRLMRAIVEGMNDQGCLILIEKLTLSDSLFNRLFIRYYYNMKKRRGYSEVEIAHKREALENVLIPYRPEENRELLAQAGFNHIEEFFRWYNFCGIIAVK